MREVGRKFQVGKAVKESNLVKEGRGNRRDSVRNRGNRVIIVRRLPEESPSFLYSRAPQFKGMQVTKL